MSLSRNGFFNVYNKGTIMKQKLQNIVKIIFYFDCLLVDFVYLPKDLN